MSHAPQPLALICTPPPILLICSMLENLCKFIVIKHSLLNWSLFVHLIHFIISKSITNTCKQLPKSILMNHTNVVLIKTTKSILYNLLWISSLQSFTKHCQEHREVNWTRSLSHHSLKVILCRILAKTGQHVMEIFMINETISVLINHVESLFEFLDLVLVKHSKHIAGCSLSSLLCGSSATCCFTR